MKISKKQEFVVLSKEDFKQAAGIDTYKGIIVLFDDDFDQRIFIFLKQYYEKLIGSVKAVYETHGTITLYCHKKPSDFIVSLNTVDIYDDVWNIIIKNIWEEIYE
jgi:hypothetical protein